MSTSGVHQSKTVFTMGRNKRIARSKCNREMRSDHLQRHEQKGGCAKSLQMIEKKKAIRAKVAKLEATMKTTLQSGLYKDIYHVFYRTDKFKDGYTKEDVFKYFDVLDHITCECGKKKFNN